MVGVQDEEDLERPNEHRIRLVLRLRHPGHHRQEVLDVAEVVVGIDERQSLPVPINERGKRRHLRQQADDRDVALLGILDALRFRIEGRQRGDAAAEHGHRVRVVAESLEEALDVLVDVRVIRDVVHPRVILALRWQLAIAQQPRHLEKGRALGELLDRIPAIAQYPLVAVDERDRALARRRVHERGVVRHEPELVRRGLDLAQVHRSDDGVPLDAGLEHLQRIRLSGTGILDVERAGGAQLCARSLGGGRRYSIRHATFSSEMQAASRSQPPPQPHLCNLLDACHQRHLREEWTAS